jgi:hypothetical protein
MMKAFCVATAKKKVNENNTTLNVTWESHT